MQTTYFKRRATCSCRDTEHIYTFPARIVPDCVEPELIVTPNALFFTAAADGGGAQAVYVYTTVQYWTVVQVNAVGGTPLSTPSTWFTLPQNNQEGSTAGTPLSVTVSSTSTTVRTALLRVTAVNNPALYDYFTITQMGTGSTPVMGGGPFVGAFWRNE